MLAALAAAAVLAAAPAGGGGAGGGGGAAAAEREKQEKLEARQKLEKELAEAKAAREAAVKRRDEEQLKAHTYGLPRHRLAAEEAQKQIDELDRKIPALEAALRASR